ncbi:MAG: hypothetical protein ACUVV6_03340 [Thermoplasmatota archaeon]
MIVRSGHFTFPRKVRYRDLARVFPDLMTLFLKESDQMPEDEALVRVLIKTNMADLQNDRKPEGFNRDNHVRLIFPVTRGDVSFYIYRSTRSEEVARITEVVSGFLKTRGLPHKVEWDKMLLYRYKERRSRRTEPPPLGS